jgi:RNA-binding protein
VAGIEEYQLPGVPIPMEKKRSDSGFHDLKPTIWIGKQGMSDTILDEIQNQIKVRKVIKVKWLSSVEIDPESVAAQSRTKLLQVRGRTMVLGDSKLYQ